MEAQRLSQGRSRIAEGPLLDLALCTKHSLVQIRKGDILLFSSLGVIDGFKMTDEELVLSPSVSLRTSSVEGLTTMGRLR